MISRKFTSHKNISLSLVLVTRVPDYINLCRRKSKRLHDHDVEILEEQTQFCTNHEKYADMCSLDRLELTASALNDRLHELKIPH